MDCLEIMDICSYDIDKAKALIDAILSESGLEKYVESLPVPTATANPSGERQGKH